MSQFIRLHVGSFIIVHGYDKYNQQIEEAHQVDGFVEKLIAIDRIQSLTEKYILTTSSHDRVIYWEYQESLGEVAARLQHRNLLV